MNWFIDQEVELTKGAIAGEKRTNITPLAYPGSANAHQWRVYVKNHGIPLDLTGNTVTAYFQRSDGNVVVVQGDTIDNMAYVIIPAEVYAISGIVKAYMDVVLAGSAITPVAGITFNVPQNMSGDIIDPGEVIPASLEELLAEIDAMRQATAEARAVVSSSVRYDSAQTLTDAQKETARGNINAASVGDVGDLRSALTDVEQVVYQESLGINIGVAINRKINTVALWQSTTSESIGCYLVKIPDGCAAIEIEPNSVSGLSIYSLLTTDTPTTPGTSPSYATGYSNAVEISEKTWINLPDDAIYLYLRKAESEETEYTPNSVVGYYDSIAAIKNEVDTLTDDISEVWAGKSGVTVYTKQQLLNSFDLYSTDLLYFAANRMVGTVFPTGNEPKTNTGAYTILFDISDVISITYPKYKNTGGYGCLVLDANMIVTRNLANISDPSGTMATIQFTSSEKYFVFNVNSTLAEDTWDLTITKAPTSGLNEVNDEIKHIKDIINTDIQNSIYSNPVLNAEIVGFICYGQSWSMGYDTDAIVSEQRYDSLMLDSGLMNNPVSNLVVSASSLSPLVEATVWNSPSQTQKCGETPCTAQTDIIKQLLISENGLNPSDIKYQIFSAAPGMGNKSLEELAYGTDYYNRLIDVITTANNLARAQGKVFVVPAISWAQGRATSNDDTYYDQLEELRVHMDTDIKAITGQTIPVKLIAWQAVFGSTTPKRFYDRYVYASEKYENIICSGTFYNYEHVANNNLHLTANSQDWLGTQFGIAYKRSIIDGEKFIPLKPKKVEVYGNIVYIDFYVPVKPLVFDTTLVAEVANKGFQIIDANSVEKTITAVEIVSPDRVKLVCSSNVVSTDHIVYGNVGGTNYSPTTGKRGNLRDSQNIIYTNHNNVALPCYNWCVVFDKTISELTV